MKDVDGNERDIDDDDNVTSEQEVGLDDLSTLSELSPSVILQHIRKRFDNGKYYTFLGDVLVTVNPCRETGLHTNEEQYDESEFCDIPHIYWTAQQAYLLLLDTGSRQCIISTGYSGSGKSEVYKNLVRHLVYMSSLRMPPSTTYTVLDDLHDRAVLIGQLLAVFGNASTNLNENASRFSKYLELHYSAEGYLQSASVHAHIFETSRVLGQVPHERNFHIFYCLMAGMTEKQKTQYCLEETYLYRSIANDMGSGNGPLSGPGRKFYQDLYQEWLTIMYLVGFSREDVNMVISVLASILNLTAVCFEDGSDGIRIAEQSRVQTVATLLSLDVDRLTSVMTCNSVFQRGEYVAFKKNKFQAEKDRDAMAKALYSGLFDWIVHIINTKLMHTSSTRSIGVLDFPGFAGQQHNGFEQLCINAANERVQMFFNDTIFCSEMSDCKYECVEGECITFADNQRVVELLLQEPGGLIHTFDNETVTSNTSVSQLLNKNSSFLWTSEMYSTVRVNDDLFSIRHYGGWVTYDGQAILARNRERPTTYLRECIQSSSNGYIACLLDETDRVHGQDENARSTGIKSKTFQRSLVELLDKLSNARPWFVTCIRPNNNRSPSSVSETFVMEQIEASNLSQVASIRRDGYSVRMLPSEFIDRFRDISYSPDRVVEPTICSVDNILKDAGIDDYQVGETKVFLRHWQEPYLRELVEAIHNDQAPKPTTPSSEFTEETEDKSVVTSVDSYDLINEEQGAGNSSGHYKQSGSADMVSEWMRQTENHPPDVTLPPYRLERPSLTEQQIRELNERRILDPRWWDRFQMIPREHMSSSTTFQTVFKFFKILCYFLLFAVVLTSGVVNKLCILIMTSSIPKSNHPECDWPTKTMLILSMCFPYAQWFLTYTGKSLFGSSTWPSMSLLSMVLLLELFHTFGLCLLVFRVLPYLDILRCFVVLGSVYMVPAMLKTVFEGRDIGSRPARRIATLTLNLGAFLIQFGSIIGCLVFNLNFSQNAKDTFIEIVNTGESSSVITRSALKGDNPSVMWEIPVALILISLSYWENYIDGDFVIFGRTLKFKNWKRQLHHSRARVYIFASVWKAIWVVVFAVLLQSGFRFNLDYSDTPTIGNSSATDGPESNTQSINHLFDMSPSTAKHYEKYGVLYLQIISNIIMTYFGGIACRMCMQIVGFSLPLVLVTPVSIGVVVLQCMYKVVPTGIFVVIGIDADDQTWILHLAWLGILWLSEMFITSHIWFPSNGRMEQIDRLFVTPLKYGILTDQSLILRRRRNDHDASMNPDDDNSSVHTDTDTCKADDVVPLIYACATMWHETRAEMSNLLKSIFRMDIDHSGRYLAQKFYKIRDPDYYEFEAHIFFDDAMELLDEDKVIPNSFVGDFLECVDDSLSSVHERQISLGPPTATSTPYGGRLTWKLPGGTRLVVHLKDKHKIRHKKRWSQVMYMYYLLGYQLLAQPENLLKKTIFDNEGTEQEFQRVTLTDAQLRRRRKSAHFTRSVIFNYVTDDVHTQAENTYILTLDGDVDFHPDAVRLLVDRLKTNKKVGAACGRIHPVGSGPLLWYQQFEYAIGHWLQKATEHVFGCVLCAPGCFSLFRGSALMDDNVARTYATRATEAGHYVQFDQGEDRWLSTLLLQQGYRIDYCAASDALTHAPETFSEFFNQRRRWGPSTLANIIDLLGNWKQTIKLNDNISTLYILYQFCMMISTILGPATILLMMAGAFTVVFKTDVLTSYILAIVPAVLFMLVCIYGKASLQMTFASIMSACYAIIMTIVLVGTISQAVEGGLTSPNVIFLVLLVVIFFISALMHPEEFSCVIPGALYFICLPTGYLLLTIYYLCNMHIVSWGTREGPDRKSSKELLQEKEAAEEKKQKKEAKQKGFLGLIGFNSFFREMREFTKQLRTTEPKLEKSSTDILLEELITELRRDRDSCKQPRAQSVVTLTEDGTQTECLNACSLKEEENQSQVLEEKVWSPNSIYDDMAWLQCRQLDRVAIKHLAEKESVFWKQLITKYLEPINEDKIHQTKVASDLKNLRNNVVFGFFMSSALWVALSMQLQILQEELKGIIFFKIPRWDSDEDLSFEPLGLIFLVFFATILFVQFVGMFAHRWGTVLHMLSITEISCGKHFTEKDKVREIITKAMELQRLCNIENEAIPDYEEPLPDYDESDVEDTLEVSSTTTSDSLPVSPLTDNPPSYQRTVEPVKRKRRRLNIFNKKGHSTGSALRKAFEKRFRLENQKQDCGLDEDSVV